jgi:nicotinamidase-related amidase
VANHGRVALRCAFRERGLERLFLTVGSERDDWSDLAGPLRGLCRAVNARVGEPEHEILGELRPQDDEQVLNKTSFSPFASTPVDGLLRERGVSTLVFAGLTTNMCVEHTLRDAADRGYSCVLVEDACATDSPEMHEGTLRNVSRLYGAVSTTGEVVASLGALPAPVGSG